MRKPHYERIVNEPQEVTPMPSERISFMRGKPVDFGERVGTLVYGSMVETIGVPRKDRFNWSCGNGIAQYVTQERSRP
jgi:hypothetical protein